MLDSTQNRGRGAVELAEDQGHAGKGGAAGAAQIHLRPTACAPTGWLPAAGCVALSSGWAGVGSTS